MRNNNRSAYDCGNDRDEEADDNDEHEFEVVFYEHREAPYNPFPSQLSQPPRNDKERTAGSPVVEVQPIYRENGNGVSLSSPQALTKAPTLSVDLAVNENDFASLEAFLQEHDATRPARTHPVTATGPLHSVDASPSRHRHNNTTVLPHITAESDKDVPTESLLLSSGKATSIQTTQHAAPNHDNTPTFQTNQCLPSHRRTPTLRSSPVSQATSIPESTVWEKSRRMTLRHTIHHHTNNNTAMSNVHQKANKNHNLNTIAAAATTTTTTQKQDVHSSPARVVSVSNASSSIVGSRPLHWKVPAKKREAPKCRSALQILPPPANTRNQLSLPSTSSIKRVRTTAPFSHAIHVTMEHDPILEEEVRVTTSVIASSTTTTSPSSQPVLSFTPSFLTARHGSYTGSQTMKSDTLGTRHDSFAPAPLMLAGSLSASVSSPLPPVRYRATKGTGRFSRRLQILRDSEQANLVRLQSGQYPFTAIPLDTNDPRTRARNVMDVSILGKSMEWQCPHRETTNKVTFLAYLHTYHSCVAYAKDRNTETLFTHPKESTLIWVCFSCHTAREHHIKQGTQLRIYNTVSIACRRLEGDMVEPRSRSDGDIDESQSTSPTAPCYMVLCTDLCEPYPAILPKLVPGVAAICLRHVVGNTHE